MEPFDIEKAKAGAPVCTRIGEKVKILSYNCEIFNNNRPIVAVIDRDDEFLICSYTIDGKRQKDSRSEYDLFMKDENPLIKEIKRRKELLLREKEKACSAKEHLLLASRIATLEELLVFANEKQDKSKFKIERDKWYICTKDLYDHYENRIFCKGDIYFSPKDGSLIPTNSNVPCEIYSPETYFENWPLTKELAEQTSNL